MDLVEDKNTKNKLLKLKIISAFYIVAILTMIFLIVLVTTIARPGKVEGSSMYPTLKDNQFITINTLIDKKNIKEGDIIVYNSPQNKKVVKRVVAVNAHSIEVKNDKLYIDGKETDYPFSKGNRELKVINDGEFFAMGDNQSNSIDSFTYGPVKFERIIGKVNVKDKLKINFIK